MSRESVMRDLNNWAIDNGLEPPHYLTWVNGVPEYREDRLRAAACLRFELGERS